MTGKIQYDFTEQVWKYDGTAGWYFISLPTEIAKEIREMLKTQEEGWGRLKALAKTGKSEWKTAIWFDTKLNTYLLPLKSEIRKKENLKLNEKVSVSIWL